MVREAVRIHAPGKKNKVREDKRELVREAVRIHAPGKKNKVREDKRELVREVVRRHAPGKKKVDFIQRHVTTAWFTGLVVRNEMAS